MEIRDIEVVTEDSLKVLGMDLKAVERNWESRQMERN